MENQQYVRYSIQIQIKKFNVNKLNGIYMLTVQPHCLPFMAPKYKTQYFSAEMCDDLITQLLVMKRISLMSKKLEEKIY